MNTQSKRSLRWFYIWYQPKYSLNSEDWQYIGLLLLASLWAFSLGLVIGFLWAAIL